MSRCVAPRSSRRWVLMVLFALVLRASGSPVAAQYAQPPVYPHVDLSIAYEVDPSWPQRPAEMQWAEMSGIAVDRHNHVWLFTRATPPVQVYDTSGKLVRAWGTETIGRAHLLRFDRDGNVWVSDVAHHTVMQFTPEGKLLKTIGTPDQPGCDQTHLNKPTDVAIAANGDLFISDGYGNNRVVHLDRNGRFIKEWGKLGSGPGEFSLPHSIVMDSQGRLYVADRNNARIQVFDVAGRFLAEWRNVMVPWCITITKDDHLWVTGSSPMVWRPEDKNLGCPPKDQMVVRFDTSGRVLQLWTFPLGEEGKEQPGQLNWIHAIGVDSQGNLYLGDIRGRRAQKFVRKG